MIISWKEVKYFILATEYSNIIWIFNKKNYCAVTWAKVLHAHNDQNLYFPQGDNYLCSKYQQDSPLIGIGLLILTLI